MNLLRSIYTAVENKRVVPSLAPELVADVSLDVEPDAATPRPGRASGFAMFIAYCDADGNETTRRIACRRIDLGTGLLHAHCFERNAWRAFRADRIIAAFCAETGEELDTQSLLWDLKARGLPADDARLARALTVLVFLMHCDGEDHALERDAISDAVTSFAIRFEGDDDTVADGERLARRLAPDGQDFVRALKWLSRHSDGRRLARFLIDHAGAVVNADGYLRAPEVQFGDEVSQYLKSLAIV